MNTLILSVSMVQPITTTVTRTIIRNLQGVSYWQRRIRSIIGSLFGLRLNGLVSFLPGRQGFFCSILTGILSSRNIAYKLLNFFERLLSTLLWLYTLILRLGIAMLGVHITWTIGTNCTYLSWCNFFVERLATSMIWNHL